MPASGYGRAFFFVIQIISGKLPQFLGRIEADKLFSRDEHLIQAFRVIAQKK